MRAGSRRAVPEQQECAVMLFLAGAFLLLLGVLIPGAPALFPAGAVCITLWGAIWFMRAVFS